MEFCPNGFEQRFSAHFLPPFFTYGIGVLSVALALLLTLYVPAICAGSPLLFFLLAVIVSAWAGGVKSGLCATVLATLSIVFWVLPSTADFTLTAGQWLQLVSFFTLAVPILGLVASQPRRNTASHQAAEERFTKVFQASPLILTLSRVADGQLIEVNESFVHTTGYQRAEVLGRTPIEIGLWIEPAIRNDIQQCLQTGQPVRNLETRFRMKDGHERTCLISVELLDVHGEVCVLSVVSDITERKQAEEALRTSEARLNTILQNIPAAVYMLTTDHHYLFVNRTFEQENQVTNEAIRGLSIYDRFAPDVAAALAVNEQAVLRSKVPIELEEVAPRNGKLHYYTTVKAPLLDADGEPYAILGVSINITARKQAEAEREHLLHELATERAQLQALTATLEQQVQERTAELTKRLQELDQFAYITSHDLKAPLRAIDHLAHWISEDAAHLLPPTSQEHLAKMRGRINRMDRLLDDLLAYSRADRYQYGTEKVDVAELVDDIVRLVTPPQGFAVSPETPLPSVRTQKVPLETVLRNLISNAIKHHDRSDGQVRVAVQDLGEWFAFDIRDDGPGIAPEFHERIFQMFQTLKPRDTVEGSGMGLAIVKKIVEARGGMVAVASSVGQGATFRFTWPKG